MGRAQFKKRAAGRKRAGGSSSALLRCVCKRRDDEGARTVSDPERLLLPLPLASASVAPPHLFSSLPAAVPLTPSAPLFPSHVPLSELLRFEWGLYLPLRCETSSRPESSSPFAKRRITGARLSGEIGNVHPLFLLLRCTSTPFPL